MYVFRFRNAQIVDRVELSETTVTTSLRSSFRPQRSNFDKQSIESNVSKLRSHLRSSFRAQRSTFDFVLFSTRVHGRNASSSLFLNKRDTKGLGARRSQTMHCSLPSASPKYHVVVVLYSYCNKKGAV